MELKNNNFALYTDTEIRGKPIEENITVWEEREA
jgi:hypothetical protein